MSRSFISGCFLLLSVACFAQTDSLTAPPRTDSLQNPAQTDSLPAPASIDRIVYTQPYGLRVGVDLSRLIRSFLNEDYTGLELTGDYRLSQNLYLAAELGNEERTQREELGNENNPNRTILYEYTTSGSYLKAGVDFNTYENWYGMNNTIFIGGRLGLSSHSQTLTSYRLFESNRYWNPGELPAGSAQLGEYKGLSASWVEFLFGIKAELFANLYLGASVRLGLLLGNKESGSLPNLWVPGFNKITEGSRFGAGYNYSITYLIPLYRKASSKKDPIPEPREE